MIRWPVRVSLAFTGPGYAKSQLSLLRGRLEPETGAAERLEGKHNGRNGMVQGPALTLFGIGLSRGERDHGSGSGSARMGAERAGHSCS